MKPLRLAVALSLALAGSLATAPPAGAGGWAATVLDPLPERIESGRTYTIGYWVLQHAGHPYNGELNESGKLGQTGLKIVSEGGAVHTFDGVRLGQPAHFSAAVVVPHPGTWEVYALQGMFDDYRIGTLEVPGGLEAEPLPSPVHSDDYEWGRISPPEVAHEGQHDVRSGDAQPALDDGAGGDSSETGAASDRGAGPPSTDATSRTAPSSAPVTAILVALAGLTGASGILLFARHRVAAALRSKGAERR